mmetsp:Transcript_20573/g.59589  ORF Transcript_20573/g.59589 Transcript_20573/m.59589 type:complete len:81 (-) Transcript_20573:43-285(-)
MPCGCMPEQPHERAGVDHELSVIAHLVDAAQFSCTVHISTLSGSSDGGWFSLEAHPSLLLQLGLLLWPGDPVSLFMMQSL